MKLRRFVRAFAMTVAAAAPAVAQPMTHGTQPGTLHAPLESADRCTECHAGLMTPSGDPYLPADLWPPSMHANAVRDPLFLATLSVAEQQAPGTGVLCLRCHAPVAFTGGRAADGYGRRLDATLGDRDGVHCDTCHRSTVDAADGNAPYLSNAQLTYSDGVDGGIPTRFGPREDPFTSPRHPSQGSAWIEDSRLCGQCHNVDHPTQHRLNADGSDTGLPFPLQSTFAEWVQSDFARRSEPRTCQNCHMPDVEGPNMATTRIPNAPLREGIPRHDFFGGNEWAMAMMRNADPGAMDTAYDTARAGVQASLRSAATLAITQVPTTGAAGATVQLVVRVTNTTGHKLPTGFEDARLMWLQVQVGSTVVSGAYADAEFVRDAQARVYEFQPGHIVNGQAVPSDFVVQHSVVLSDTRIPPLGMRADARTAPVGRDYAGGADGTLRNYDDATFRITLPATAGAVPVTVRLMYRATTKHYVDAIAAADTADTRGRDIQRIFAATQQAAPYPMATATAMINVSAADASGGGVSCAVRTPSTSTRAPLGLVGAALAAWALRRRRRS